MALKNNYNNYPKAIAINYFLFHYKTGRFQIVKISIVW